MTANTFFGTSTACFSGEVKGSHRSDDDCDRDDHDHHGGKGKDKDKDDARAQAPVARPSGVQFPSGAFGFEHRNGARPAPAW